MKNIQKKETIADNFWQGKRVLVTGHNGFKGSWLSLWLLQMGAKVSGISLAPDNQPCLFDQLSIEDQMDSRILDIREKDKLRCAVKEINPDIVFHLAAQPLVLRSYKDPVETWETNVMGTVFLLEALRSLDKMCSAILITTDKVYRNDEWLYGYRENDPLGGFDPYSSSKAASELAIASWRSSFCGNLSHQKENLLIASARAGNVIGGGDWSENRIVPDIIRSLQANKQIIIRNPSSTRPWQHVLEPLSGYLLLAKQLTKKGINYASSFNFGPQLGYNKTVLELVQESLKFWPGEYIFQDYSKAPHEAGMLNLSTDKSFHQLKWQPKWDFSTTISRTINWYKNIYENKSSALESSLEDLSIYTQ